MMRILYGNAPASARFDTARRFLSVDLDTDPGNGSMSFGRISPTVVHVTGGDVADIARAAEIYRTAARYLDPGPGRDRHTAEAARLEALTAAHHGYAVRSRVDGSYDARCACGAAVVVFTPAAGASWHGDHIAGRIPGQEPSPIGVGD